VAASHSLFFDVTCQKATVFQPVFTLLLPLATQPQMRPDSYPNLALYRVAQKVSHYQKSQLNRIKTRHYG